METEKYIAPAKYIYLVAIVFIMATILGILSAENNPQTATQSIRELSQSLAFTQDFTPIELTLFIFLNNSIKAMIAMLSGILLGIFTVLFIIVNGYLIGVILDLSYVQFGVLKTIIAILPHGFFELTAVGLACANGLFLGAKLFKKLQGKGRIKAYLQQAIKGFALIILPLLFVSAIIETFITAFLAGGF